MDPRIPKGIQEIQADIVSNKPDVRVDDLDRMPRAIDPSIPTALQGIDEHGIAREKGFLESAMDTIAGTYETVKDKTSNLVNSSYAQKAENQIKDLGNAAQKKLDEMRSEPDVPVNQLDQVPRHNDANIPTTLQGTQDHGIDHGKGILETVKEKIGGLMGGHQEKSAGDQMREMGQTAQKKFEDVSETSKEYLGTAGEKMKSAGEYLNEKAQNKNSCEDTSAAIKKYAEMSADKVADMCEAGREYMDAAGDKMKAAGDYLQKKAD